MKVSDPLPRGLRTALQLTITLLSTGALVTVLNGLLHTPGGVQRRLGRPAALRDHRPELARRPGKEVVPGVPGVRKTLLPMALSIRAPRVELCQPWQRLTPSWQG
jgi:hypothetical protein